MSKISDYINSQYSIGDAYQLSLNRKLYKASKCYCPNPLHNNTDTPAAKAYEDSIFCFVCRQSYRPYDLFKWYRPDILEEVNSTIILPEQQSQKEFTRIEKCRSFDRSWTIDKILKEILNDTQTN